MLCKFLFVDVVAVVIVGFVYMVSVVDPFVKMVVQAFVEVVSAAAAVDFVFVAVPQFVV